MKSPELPHIIAAPDYKDAADIKSLMQKLRLVGTFDLGVKIPDWHNQNQDLIKMLVDQGRYVILDTNIHNTASKMRTATESFLSRAVLPTAITVNPVKQITPEGNQTLIRHVVKPAHQAGVQIIGYAEHDDLEHTDDHFMEREASRYGRGASLGFDAFELHATTVRSEYFADSQQRLNNISELAAPRVIVSKHAEGTHSSRAIIQQTVEILESGIDAVYMGNSLMGASDPARLVRQILDKI